MENKAIISIIIPTWNTSLVTKKCVDTLFKCLPANFAQIIVVDNGSTDDTSLVFSKLKNIVYLQNPSNLGFSKACNQGAQKATAKYLFFLNSDMELIDNHLLSMVDFLKNNTSIGLIGPQFLNSDLSVQGSVFPPQTVTNALKEFWLGQNSYSKYIPPTTQPTKVWAISGGAVLINRALFNQIGGWNEKYFMYYEDLDLCRQVRNAGKDIYYYPEFKVIHRHGLSGQSLVDSANQWRRGVPSSKLYFGLYQHYLLFFITWTSQHFKKLCTIAQSLAFPKSKH